jgi:ankyrin repeat protein
MQARKARISGDPVEAARYRAMLIATGVLLAAIALGWAFLTAPIPLSRMARFGILFVLLPFVKIPLLMVMESADRMRTRAPRQERFQRAMRVVMPLAHIAIAGMNLYIASLAFYGALGSAAMTGNTADARLVLSLGLSPNGGGIFFTRPIDEAAASRHLSLVKLLVQHGATIDPPPNANVISPLAWAAHNGDLPMIQYLIAHGAKVDGATRTGITPLALAARNGQIPAARLLLTDGANVNAANRGGGTPLMMAAGHGHCAMVRFLIARGAQVNAATFSGGTALRYAAAYGDVGTVNALIAAGGDFNRRDSWGMTPLSWAWKNGRLDVAYTLIVDGDEIAPV